MTHLSDEAVEWLARHGARPERRGAAIQLGYIQHLEECEECRGRVEKERGQVELIDRVKVGSFWSK